MKTIILTTLVSLISLNTFASLEGEGEREEVNTQVREMVVNEDLFASMNYDGELSISFTIDDNNQVHIADVETNDYSLEYHVRQTLENAKVIACESLVGKTIALVIDLVQAK
jgi:hypothetical protein